MYINFFKTDFSKTSLQKTNSPRSYSLDPARNRNLYLISQYTHWVLGIWESTSIRELVYIWTTIRSRHYSLLISAHIGRSGSFPRSCRSFFANNRSKQLSHPLQTPLWRQSSHHALIAMVIEFNHIKCSRISTIRNIHTNWYLQFQSFSTMHAFKYDFIIGL